MADEPALPDDAQRELNARRRDLEREFDDKARELKAQHKRQMDRLQQDRVEWEEHKKMQAKELADKAERYRRKEGNAVKASDDRAALSDEVEDLRARTSRLEEEKLKAKVAREALDERVAKLTLHAAQSSTYLAALAGFIVVAVAAWLLVTVQDGGDLLLPAVVAVGGVLLVALALRHRNRLR